MNWQLIRFLTAVVVPSLILALLVGFDLTRRGMHRFADEQEWSLPDASPENGRVLLAEYGCGSCHVISGVPDAVGRVGPKLEDFRNQMYIAGIRTNTPANLVEWIQKPQEMNPQTAMPDLKVTEEEARDMAAYLMRAMP